MQTLAPVSLFVYNRPWHLKQTLESLEKNFLSGQSVLYIYSDGPRADATPEQLQKIKEVRSLIRSKKWCKETYIIESETNKGLAKSIIEGVTELVNDFGKEIVLEDDLVLSPGFLKYMNEALTLYESEERVMHVSGYIFETSLKLPETLFY